MRNKPKPTESDPETTAPYDAEALLRRTADCLGSVLDSITAGLATAPDDGVHQSSVREVAKVATAIGSITGELRAREKLADARIRNITHQQVLAHLRQLTPERRDAVIRDLQQMDDEGSVLG